MKKCVSRTALAARAPNHSWHCARFFILSSSEFTHRDASATGIQTGSGKKSSGGLNRGGDQAGVVLRALGAQVDAIRPEKLGPIVARRVPVNQHGVRIPLHTLGQDDIVRAFPGAGDLVIHEHDPARTAEYLHDLVELLGSERPVVAEVNDHDRAEPARRLMCPQDVDRSRDLAADRRVNPNAGDGLLELAGGAEHH